MFTSINFHNLFKSFIVFEKKFSGFFVYSENIVFIISVISNLICETFNFVDWTLFAIQEDKKESKWFAIPLQKTKNFAF